MVDDRKVAFNWYLNRQGPRGPQGVKGDTGFSPNITVETDTLNEYILRITNEGGYFLTSNLREHKEDRGGTYIRYDRDNGVMYAGEADTATDAKAGMIKIATAEDVEAEDESTAVTPAILADYVAGTGGASIDDTTVSSSKVWSSEKTNQSIAAVSNQVATNTTDISNIKTALPNKQNKLTAGTNITIEGDVISATSSGSGDVTLAGDNSFTGNNTFDGVSTFNGDTWVDSLKVGTSLTNQQDKKFLAQGSITAGNNISIEETTDGIKISSTGGGGGTTIDDSTTSSTSTWSSSKINSEVTTAVDTINSTKNDNIFDISKFTVVGSLTITNDGIASGFSTNNYLKCLTNFDFSKNFSIECLFTTGDDTTTEQHLWETIVGRGINLQVKNNKFALAVGDGTNWISVSSSNSNATANTSYKAKVIHTLTGYKLYINEVEEINIPTITTVPTQDLYICRNGCFVGSIDLKQFSITVDGKEVFNGLMESTKPIYDKIATTSTALSTFQTDTDNNFSAVNSALNEKANLSDLASKQNVLTAGANITIEGDVISATGGGSSEPPSNMMTTDTTQMDLSGTKYWVSGAQLGIGDGLTLDENYVSVAGKRLTITKEVVDWYTDIPVIHTSNPYIVLSARQKIKFMYDGSAGVYDILDSSHLGEYVDGTTITYTNNKLTAVGGGGSYTLPPATTTTLGGVIIGDGLTVLENGTLSAQVTGAQLEALQRLINDLSTKVDNLTTRLNNLEEVIDGGIA